MRVTDITEAIFQKYQGSVSLMTTLLGGLYFQQAPQDDINFPYGVFYINGITTETEVMSTQPVVNDRNIYEVEVQFNLFSDILDDGDEIALLLDKFSEAFDWTNLSVNGQTCIKMQRESVTPILFVDDIWQATINYMLGLQKEN